MFLFLILCTPFDIVFFKLQSVIDSARISHRLNLSVFMDTSMKHHLDLMIDFADILCAGSKPPGDIIFSGTHSGDSHVLVF